MKKGWECPKCGRIIAPHIKTCQACLDAKEGIKKVGGGKEAKDGMIKES